MEICARALQRCEEKHNERMGSKDEETPVADPLFEHHLYLGMGMTSYNVCVGSLLAQWVSDELRKEAAITKERRKDREERTLAEGGPPAASAKKK